LEKQITSLRAMTFREKELTRSSIRSQTFANVEILFDVGRFFVRSTAAPFNIINDGNEVNRISRPIMT
ncbi:hypothetical protein K0M31_003578, partial [Melipona bicolor]